MRKPNGYWNDFTNVERELLDFIEKHGTPGIMPTAVELRKSRSSTLAAAIDKQGGFELLSERLGLKFTYTAKPPGYWEEFKNLKFELLEFIKLFGSPGVMPTQNELTEAGKSGLARAISKHGGWKSVAEQLGLNHERKSHRYWYDFSNLKAEIFSFIQEKGTPGVMPTSENLRQAGKGKIEQAIYKHGGQQSVAERLGLTYAKKSTAYWDNFSNVESELLNFIEEQGTPGLIPTRDKLNKAGKGNLAAAIDKHGGYQSVAEKLGLTYAKKRNRYWQDFSNLKSAIFAFNEKQGTPGVMPRHEDLRKARLNGLCDAIQKHGGYAAVAKQLGLKLTYSKKQNKYWQDFSNIEHEIFSFIEEHGTPGVMPTADELRKARQNSLGYAIQQHGGYSVVARRLGLTHTGNEHITSGTASEVEKTARAIQPLAESNLLSGAQVMVILRRAGLLEYRNHRVVRLNASLARGKHEEIENAIAQLASASEQLTTEPITIEESEDITASEAEALISSGLDTSENPPLTQSPSNSTEPDTQREQAVIRGLSALGELRLPLDEVLQLLTSKILWQAFYKRLYAWYGGLDAAQNITNEDVEAAILSAYPEHTDNEFVAEASAKFTEEVKQAVNFAASLPNSGWHGFRLRLHQADAARRMAEVLSNQEADCPFLLNADDPGMGKSASFLAAVCASGIRRVLLVAPKTVADDTWIATHGEIRRCLPHARIVRGLQKALTTTESSKLTFFVLHYEELLNEDAVAALAEQSFDCLCLDEIHFIKQRAGQESTRRRTALATLRAAARAAIGLTGTPLINELAEPMSLLQALSQNLPQFDHSRLNNRRLSDIADVFEALLPHVNRRRKPEVLLHLPNCDVQLVNIVLPPDIEEQTLEIHRWPKRRATEALIQLRKLATEAKLPYLQQRAFFAGKLLILTYLTDDVSERIAAYLEEFLPHQVAHINGQTPKDERQKFLDSFRNPKGVRVLVGTIGTIGTGLTLFDPKGEETANEIIFADLPYTYAEFDQGVARLYREGQKQRVCVEVLQTRTTATQRDGSALHTLDESIWALIQGKRELSDVAIDGKYDTTGAAAKVQKALHRWLKQAREIGVEPLAVERRSDEQTEAQKWRSQIGHLRSLSAAKADEVFADPDFTRNFLAHLKTAPTAQCSHQWLRAKLSLLLRHDLNVVDMGCGLNPFAELPCRVIGLDRHDLPGQLRGKMENPPLPDKSADVLIYSLCLYGTAADLLAYFTQAARILRGGGHLFIVEPALSFTPEGLARFVNGLRQFGFELVGSVKELRNKDGALLKGIHFTLTGEMGQPEEIWFEKK